MTENPAKPTGPAIAALLAALLVFALDVSLELGVAVGVAYVGAVWLAQYTARRMLVLACAGVCTGLIGAGYALSPPTEDAWKAILNRGLSIFAVWVTTAVVLRLMAIPRVTQTLDETDKTLKSLGLKTRPSANPQMRLALAGILVVSLGIHIGCLIAGRTVLEGWTWHNHPVHAAVEMAGSLIALWVAWMLLSLNKRGSGTSYNIAIAGALIGMGVLDGLHSIVHAGQEFVWLHSTATLLGGILFAVVWLPEVWRKQMADWWPGTVLAGSLAFGVFSLLFPDSTPTMVANGQFTGWARSLNVAGGALMFIAAGKLVIQYRESQNIDDLLFFLHCALFGAAAVMFEESELWDAPWWGWHLLRMLAYAVAMWFVVLTDQRERAVLTHYASEMKERQRKLLEARREYQDLYDNSPDLHVSVNAETGLVELCNKTVASSLGYEKSELIGQPVLDLYHPDSLTAAKAVFEQFRTTGEVRDAELQLQRRDGSKIDVSLRVTSIRDADGNVIRSRSVWRDITIRKQALAALRERDIRIAALLDSTAEGIYGLDLEGNCTFVNKACAELLGYESPEDFLGRNMHELVHYKHLDGTPYPNSECQIYKAFRQNRGVHVDDEVFWKKDGSSFPAEYWSHPVFQDGELTGSVLTFIDITDRKELENAQKRLNEELDRRVRARTAELAEANTALERSNNELKQFAYIASHDLQTPLRGITGFAQLLADEHGEKLDGESREWLDYIVDGSTRMKDLIDGLLSYSRVESQAKPFQPTDMNEVFADAVALSNGDILASDAIVECDELPTIQGDRAQLNQLLQNLIGNAIKYKSDRRPEVFVSARKSDGDWLFSVQDNGIGIEQKYHDRVFEIFRRLHTDDEYPGTGIGLAICQNVVKRHRGTIRFESTPGEGTTFYFTIPAESPPDGVDDHDGVHQAVAAGGSVAG